MDGHMQRVKYTDVVAGEDGEVKVLLRVVPEDDELGLFLSLSSLDARVLASLLRDADTKLAEKARKWEPMPGDPSPAEIVEELTEPQIRFMRNVCSPGGYGRGGPGGSVVFRSCKALRLCVEGKGPLHVDPTEFGSAVVAELEELD